MTPNKTTRAARWLLSGTTRGRTDDVCRLGYLGEFQSKGSIALDAQYIQGTLARGGSFVATDQGIQVFDDYGLQIAEFGRADVSGIARSGTTVTLTRHHDTIVTITTVSDEEAAALEQFVQVTILIAPIATPDRQLLPAHQPVSPFEIRTYKSQSHFNEDATRMMAAGWVYSPSLIRTGNTESQVKSYNSPSLYEHNAKRMFADGWTVANVVEHAPRAGCARWFLLGGLGALVFRPKPQVVVTYVRSEIVATYTYAPHDIG